MTSYIIEVQNLCHSYRTYRKDSGFFNALKDLFKREIIYKHAITDTSFHISSGEIVGLLGANGAGKTTLLKILSGLIHPSSGSVKVMSKTPHQKEHSFLKQIGMVMGQKSQLLWDIPALDSLHIIRELYEIPASLFQSRLDHFTNLLAIGDLLQIPVRNLSLGERMKFELIAALIHNPKLLFLDEPTIGLDIVSQRAIRQFLLVINQTQGTTIIITSHYMRDIEILAKRLLIIEKGSILYDGAPAQIMKKFELNKKIYFSSAIEKFQLSIPFEKSAQEEYVVSCHPQDLQKIVSEIVTKVPIISIRTEENSLEDAIFAIFDRKKS